MKLLVAAGAVACLATLLPLAVAQDQKHLTVFPLNGIRPVLVSANSIERGAEYPSLVQLKGNVEIRTPVCVQTGTKAHKTNPMVCDGETVLRSDEAVYHEDTGQVEARGNVTVTPVPYRHREFTGGAQKVNFRPN